MKQQMFSVLFSVLLLNTLAIEHQKARHHPQVKHNQARHNPHLVSRLQTKANNDECIWYCPELPSNQSFSLDLTINITTSVVGIENVAEKVAIVLDVVNSIVAVLNGTGGYAAFSLISETGVFVSSSSCGWVAQNESLSAYLNRQLNFKFLLEAAGGISITSEDSLVAQKFISKIIVFLSVTYKQVLESSTVSALTLVVELTKTVNQYKTSLIQFFKLCSDTTVKVSRDVISIFSFLQGAGSFGSIIEGGLEVLFQNNITFNYTEIAECKTGVDVLVYLITVIKTKIDLNVVLGSAFRDTFKLLGIINQFSGSSGLHNILYAIVAFLHKQFSIDGVLVSLLVFLATDKSGNFITREQCHASLSSLVNVTEEIDDCSIKEILSAHWIVHNVNVSAMLDVLYLDRSLSRLQSLIEVLLLLKDPLTDSIPHLIKELISNLKSEVGIALVSYLDPSLNIDKTNTSLLNEVTQNLTINQLLSTEDLLGLYLNLTVIGQIIRDVNCTLVSRGGLSIKEIFESEEGKEVLFEIGDLFIAIIRQGEARRLGRKYVPAGKLLSLHNKHHHLQNKHHKIHEKYKHFNAKHHLGLKHLERKKKTQEL